MPKNAILCNGDVGRSTGQKGQEKNGLCLQATLGTLWRPAIRDRRLLTEAQSNIPRCCCDSSRAQLSRSVLRSAVQQSGRNTPQLLNWTELGRTVGASNNCNRCSSRRESRAIRGSAILLATSDWGRRVPLLAYPAGLSNVRRRFFANGRPLWQTRAVYKLDGSARSAETFAKHAIRGGWCRGLGLIGVDGVIQVFRHAQPQSVGESANSDCFSTNFDYAEKKGTM